MFRKPLIVFIAVIVILGTVAPALSMGATAHSSAASPDKPTSSINQTTSPSAFYAIGVDERFFDGFEDGNSEGWSTSGTSVQAANSFHGDYTLYYSSDSSFTWTDGPSTSTSDSFNLTMTIHNDYSVTGTYVGEYVLTEDIELRISTDSSSTGSDDADYEIVDASSGNTLHTWGEIRRDDDTSVKFHVDNGTIKGKKWFPNEEDEPSGWDFTAEVDDTGSESQFQWSGSGNNPDWIDAYLDEVEYRGSDHTFSETVNGSVVNQHGDPVADATVELTLADTSAYSSPTPVEDARNDIRDVTDAEPSAYDAFLELGGSGGYYQTAEQKYPVVNEKAFQGSPIPLGESADLRDVSIQLPANEPLVVTAWDPTRQGRLFNQHEYDTQWPGRHLKDTTVTFEQLSPSGEVMQTVTVSTDKTFKGGAEGSFVDPDTLGYGEVVLPPGYWRATVSGTNASIVYQVGNPSAAFRNTLPEPKNNTTTDIEQQVTQLKNDGKLTNTITTTTGENGEWTAEVPVNAKVVHVQASKGNDPDLASEASLTDIENATRQRNISGSVYVPSETKIVEPPASGVEVVVTEVQFPTYGNQSALESKFDEWLDQLLTDQFSDLPSALQQPSTNVTREGLEEVYTELDQLREQNDQLQQRAERLLQQNSGSDETEVNVDVDPSNATDEELRERVSAMQTALTQLRDSVETIDTDTEASNGTATSIATFDGAVNESEVLVRAHYSNGTTRVVNESFISIDQSVGAGVTDSAGETTVRVEDYPLDGAAAVSFEYDVATERGVGGAETPVENPAFQGQFPGLRAISCNTVEPGPDTNVTCTLRDDDRGQLQGVSAVTVYGPSGQELNSTVGGQTFAFTTQSAGVHEVQITMTSASGDKFVRTLRLGASSVKQERPPGIMASSAPTGVVAVVGEGFRSGDVEIKNGGEQVVFIGEVERSDDPPGVVHVYGQGIEKPEEARADIRITRPDGSSVNQQVTVVYHGDSVPEDLNTWRVVGDDDQPMPPDGTQNGYVNRTENGTTWVAPSDENGMVGFKTSDPGLFGAKWFIETTVGINVDGFLIITPVGLAGVLIVVRRRRRREDDQAAGEASADASSRPTPAEPVTPDGPDALAGQDSGTQDESAASAGGERR